MSLREGEPEEIYVKILDSIRVNTSILYFAISAGENRSLPNTIGINPPNPPRRFFGEAVSVTVARIISENVTLRRGIFWLPLDHIESTNMVSSSLSTNSSLCELRIRVKYDESVIMNFAEALKHNQALRGFYLASWDCSLHNNDRVREKFVETAIVNKTLQELVVGSDLSYLFLPGKKIAGLQRDRHPTIWCYLRLNSFGRKYFANENLPLNLWPSILAKAAAMAKNKGDFDALYHLVSFKPELFKKDYSTAR
jgi:hypothetical protein